MTQVYPTKFKMHLICRVSLFIFWLSTFSFSQGRRECKFYAGELCDLQERVDRNCSKYASETKTFNECVFKCDLDPACVGASTAGNQGRCFHHYTCNEASGCSKKEATHKYMSKYCAHDGVWDPRTSKCVSESGWIGDHCLDLPTYCRDLQENGRPVRRMTYLTIHLESSAASPILTPAFCSVQNNWAAIYVLKNSGANFNRTWEEYRDGFYESSGNFWIGLKSWHVLSMAGYRRLTAAMNIGSKYRKYINFHVGDESQGFSFTFDSTSLVSRKKSYDASIDSSFIDCLGPLTDKPFVTRNTGNTCAMEVGSGWWHDGDRCTTSSTYCNFLGKVPRDWGEDVPVYQRMRVDGIDPIVMEQHPDDISMNMYIQRK